MKIPARGKYEMVLLAEMDNRSNIERSSIATSFYARCGMEKFCTDVGFHSPVHANCFPGIYKNEIASLTLAKTLS